MATATLSPKLRKYPVVRKRSVKSPATQAAITIKRARGQSKVSIARDLGISPNTVTSVLALNSVEDQIAEYRKEALGLAPLAITAVRTDLETPGNGALGLRVLESVGVVGDSAVDARRLNSQRSSAGINVLVQSGATVQVNAPSLPHTDGTAPVNANTAPVTNANGNAIVSNDTNSIPLAVSTDGAPAREAPKRGGGA